MALQLIYKITFTDDADTGSFSSGDVVDVYRDDSFTDPVVVVKENDVTITSGGTIGSRQNFTVSNAVDISGFWYLSRYSYCNGTTLQQFRLFNFGTFPYATLDAIENSPSCDVTITCDISMAPLDITNTNAGGDNGEIQATATTTAIGDVYYSLSEPFSYTGSNITGLFTGLTAGTYTVWAIDSNGCKVFKQGTVQDGLAYSSKYLLDFEDNDERQINVKIEEESFSGSETEVTGSGVPFVRTLRGETAEKYTSQIFPSEAEISLDSDTNRKYAEFTQNDERRYRVTAHETSLVDVKWRGFVMPEEYSEAYTHPGYSISLVAVDGLQSLSKYDFLDDSGDRIDGDRSLIDIICLILRKTDTGFSVRSAINKFEENHNTTASDDPLAQTFIDTSVYYDEDGEPEKCSVVLSNILAPFGAHIKQGLGYWWIIDIQEYKKASLTYRQFDTNGVYESNGTYNPVIDHKGSALSDRVVMADQSGFLDFQPVYQSVNLTQTLGLVNNILLNGSFKDKELNEGGFPVGLKNWDYKLNGDTGTAPNAAQSILGESMTSYIIGQGSSYLSQSFTISAGVGDVFAISFNYYLRNFGLTIGGDVTPFSLPLYLKVRFRVQLGSRYLTANGTWSSSVTDINLTSDKYNEINDVEIQSTELPITLIEQFGEVRLYSTYVLDADFTTSTSVPAMYTGLRAISTTGLSEGQFIIGAYEVSAGSYQLFYYELFAGTDAEEGTSNLYQKFRPNDYDASTNAVFWQNQDPKGRYKTITLTSSTPADQAVRFGSVVLKYLPQGEEPEDDQVKTATNYPATNRKASNTLDLDMFHGDITTTLNASKNVYKNHFRLSNGDPTFYWGRSGITERRNLLDILVTEMANEHRLARHRITMAVTNLKSSGTDLDFINVLRETQDDNRKYIVVSISKDLKDNMDQVELLEMSNTEDGAPPADNIGSAFSTGFDRQGLR